MPPPTEAARNGGEKMMIKTISEDDGSSAELVSDCCGSPDIYTGDTSLSQWGICPDCKEHCTWVEGEAEVQDLKPFGAVIQICRTCHKPDVYLNDGHNCGEYLALKHNRGDAD
jgi:hypothetical protein